MTNDILEDFLLYYIDIFVFYLLETQINTSNIKNGLPLKPTSFHRPSTYTFSKFGNEAIGNVSFTEQQNVVFILARLNSS